MTISIPVDEGAAPARSRGVPRSLLFAAFVGLLLVMLLLQIPAWVYVLHAHHTAATSTTAAAAAAASGSSASSARGESSDPRNAAATAVPLGRNPHRARILGLSGNGEDSSTRVAPNLHLRRGAELAGGQESKSVAPAALKTAGVPSLASPSPGDWQQQQQHRDAGRGLEEARLAAKAYEVTERINEELAASAIHRTAAGAHEQVVASTIAVCGSCVDLLPFAVLDSIAELRASDAAQWAELLLVMRPLVPDRHQVPGLSELLHPLHQQLWAPPQQGHSLAKTVEEQLESVAQVHRVRIVVVAILQGGVGSHRHDLDAMAWSHVLSAVLPLVAPSAASVLFLGPQAFPAAAAAPQPKSTQPGRSLLQQLLDACSGSSTITSAKCVAGVTLVAGDGAAGAAVVSAGMSVQRGEEDEPLLVDRWAGFSAFDARICSNVTAGPNIFAPSPYAFLAPTAALKKFWPRASPQIPGTAPLRAFAVPKIHKEFFVAADFADRHVNPELHAPFLAFMLSALDAGFRAVHVTPSRPLEGDELPHPSVVVDLPGWTPVGDGSDVGLGLRALSPVLHNVLEHQELVASFLPGQRNALDGSATFITGVALKWDTFCLKCFGFSNEVMHYLRPLEGQLHLRSMIGAECFCPGTPRAFSETLARLSMRKRFDKQHYDAMQGQRHDRGDAESNEAVSDGAEPARVDGQKAAERNRDVMIYVVHKDPGSFPSGNFDGGLRPDVVVGRAMYEFTKLPPQWRAHEKSVDEIWVPARFVRSIFIDNGFSKEKLFILPEPIDVFYYDPAAVQPLHLPIRDAQRRWKHASNVAVLEDTVENLEAGTMEAVGSVSGVSVAERARPSGRAVQPHANAAAAQGQEQQQRQQQHHNHHRATRLAQWLPRAVPPINPRQMRTLRRSSLAAPGRFKLLSVFKWEERKAWDVLLRSYFTAFTADDPVSLYIVAYIYGDTKRSAAAMMAKVKELLRAMEAQASDSRREPTSPPAHHDDDDDDDQYEDPTDIQDGTDAGDEKWVDDGEEGDVAAEEEQLDRPSDEQPTDHDDEELDTRRRPMEVKQIRQPTTSNRGRYTWPHVAHIEIISEQLSEDELLALYRSVDCFVLPTRGEGWGLPIIQAMSMALPTIATNWSGNTDFMTSDNSYLLRVDYLEPVPGNTMYGAAAGKYWAQPSETHLTELLRHVYTHRQESREVGIRARRHIVSHYSEEVVAEVVKQRLRFLRDQFWERHVREQQKKHVAKLLVDDGHLIL